MGSSFAWRNQVVKRKEVRLWEAEKKYLPSDVSTQPASPAQGTVESWGHRAAVISSAANESLTSGVLLING